MTLAHLPFLVLAVLVAGGAGALGWLYDRVCTWFRRGGAQ